MVQPYDHELLNKKATDNRQKVEKTLDSAKSLIEKYSTSETREHPLFVATRRLVGALDQLEGNLKQVMMPSEIDAKYEAQVGNFEKENASLKRERESLNTAIAQLQRQYNDLYKAASQAYDKLDDSVKRLSDMIEE